MTNNPLWIKRFLLLTLITVIALSFFPNTARAEEETDYSVYSDQCIFTLKKMASLLMGLGNPNEVYARVASGSEASRLLKEYFKWGRSPIGSDRFGEISSPSFIDLGDNRFFCHLSGDHICSYRTLDDLILHMEYNMYFKVENGLPLLYDFTVGPIDSVDQTIEAPDDGLVLTEIYRKAFRGYVLEVKDPSRVFVGVTSQYWSTIGRTLDWFLDTYGAVAAVNANSFDDPGGKGTGGLPIGLVVSEGKLLKETFYGYGCAGFDQNNVLHVGTFNGEEAKRLGLRDAICFGPILVKDGIIQDFSTAEPTGLNARTAIGQKADGAVLLVVLEGGQSDSLGAEIEDLADIMLEFGAVNACNMDGGPSSVMYLSTGRVSGSGVVTAYRGVPCAILVKPR